MTFKPGEYADVMADGFFADSDEPVRLRGQISAVAEDGMVTLCIPQWGGHDMKITAPAERFIAVITAKDGQLSSEAAAKAVNATQADGKPEPVDLGALMDSKAAQAAVNRSLNRQTAEPVATRGKPQQEATGRLVTVLSEAFPPRELALLEQFFIDSKLMYRNGSIGVLARAVMAARSTRQLTRKGRA